MFSRKMLRKLVKVIGMAMVMVIVGASPTYAQTNATCTENYRALPPGNFDRQQGYGLYFIHDNPQTTCTVDLVIKVSGVVVFGQHASDKPTIELNGDGLPHEETPCEETSATEYRCTTSSARAITIRAFLGSNNLGFGRYEVTGDKTLNRIVFVSEDVWFSLIPFAATTVTK